MRSPNYAIPKSRAIKLNIKYITARGARMRLKEKEFYKLLVRPTVVTTTLSKNAVPNAAPFS